MQHTVVSAFLRAWRVWLVYIGVWKILTKPVKYVVLAQLAGELSARGILGAFVQGFLYLSLAGGVWCIGYILRDYFKEK